MSSFIYKCFVLLMCLELINSNEYHDRPKIRTSNGDLFLEPAFDKSIYLLPNGPKSNVYVGERNLLKIESPDRNDQSAPIVRTDAANPNGLNEIIQRIERLESRESRLSENLMLNISRLWRRVNMLNRKVARLRLQRHRTYSDLCQSQPCKHGGTCLNLENRYYCLCPSNWEGKDCDVDVNECRNFAGTELGCQNGGICINKPGSYECLCKSSWYGIHCTRKAKDCSGGDFEMCGHGSCIQTSSGEGIKCICHQGWTTNGTGSECLTDINECETMQAPRCSVNPKVDCINLPGSFRCGSCPVGFEGDGFSCSDVNECLTIPNGGCSPLVTCHNIIGSRICSFCPMGYQGDGVTCTWKGSCNINNGGCHPSASCVGTMTTSGPGTQCICPVGMEGDGVGLQGCYVSTVFNFSQRCEGNPCGIHGQCHVLRNGYTCICFNGFGGTHCDVAKNLCAINPCLNGGICRLDDSLSAGYRCECTAQYTGPVCQIRSNTCGGVLNNEEGSIVYPISNITYAYSHKSRCAWLIHTDPEKVINVTFSKFDLQFHTDCSFDFLQIHDGRSSASQLIGRFCGKHFPNGGNIISSHNNLYVWFQSDGIVLKNGFALHWTSIQPVCGGKVNATTHGRISSPGSPGKYPPNRDCYWHLTTIYGKRIQLYFFALDIETHPNCNYDYLAIYDGEHTTDPLLNKYCNSTQPEPVQSAGSDILIHFHSDAHGSGNGFQITYAPVPGVPGCGGYFTADNGEIISPSVNGLYLNNLLCEYKIKTNIGTKIQIEFKMFNLEYSFMCQTDYLKIYDGPSSDSRLVGRFCGTTFPKTYTSTANNLFLIFKTDNSISYSGFSISYKTLCHIEIFGDSGEVKSPGYPLTYPENKVCEYIISTTPGKVIQLTFQELDIESEENTCPYDYIEIRDGPDVHSPSLGKYCGNSESIPPTQISTHNLMYVKFYSDFSNTGTGFYANYTTEEVACGGIYRKTTGVINYPSDGSMNNENEKSCSWILIAPEGLRIVLTWNRFNLETSLNCEAEYVSLIEINEDSTENVLGNFCGPNSPPALTISTNRLKIKFKSDDSSRSSGFSVLYSFIDDKNYCGGVYIKTHGFIYSPGWPKPYQTNQNCQWTITVPVGQQIKLNISQFDVEQPFHGKCDFGDYLEIRNGAAQNTPLIAKLCGIFKSRIITSTANELYLHFYSDSYLSGKGFKIEWDGTLMGCGGTLTSSTGSISSPNYPNNYNGNAECFYKIVVNPGSRIRLSFLELDLDRSYKCSDDYVEIFNGRDTNAVSLGTYCYMSPSLTNIVTATNYVFIKFRSDFYVGARGFLLNYYTICRGNITGRFGVIESPDYPNEYPLHLNCLWNITVNKGNKINVTFTHFDIFRSVRANRTWWFRRSNRVCEREYLQMKDEADDFVSSKLCGNSLPAAFTTKSNSLQIKFVTGDIPRRGFRLEWVIHGCGGHIRKENGNLILDREFIFANELECDWLIETTIGKSISISFTDVHLSETHNCTVDAIEVYNGPDTTYPLLSKVCHNDHALITADSNYLFVKLIKQSSMKQIYFSSTFNSIKSICGGVIESKSGLIYSKNYPINYDDNLDCIWTIKVPMNHRIKLNIIDIDLFSMLSIYDEHECDDRIEIFDDLSMNYTHIICPNANITQVITKSNNMQLRFVTDGYGNAKGFKANFTTICGASIAAINDGIITSDLHIPTSNCSWTIFTPNLDQKISLTITYMSLPKNIDIISNKSCSLSYLHVYDGDDNTAPLIDEYCGRKVPPMIVSKGSAITIELGTNEANIIGSFTAHYSPWNNTCGGTLTSEEGTIASPNYPGPYYGGDDCEWILETSPGNRVYITFEQLDLEFSEGCNEDYLEVRENSGGGNLLGVYCGTDIPINTTTASRLYIKFHSNKRNNGGGFLIHYGFLHGSEIVGDNGILASPLYPNLYHGSGEYSWRIIVSGSHTITLTIDRLEIQSYGSECYNKLTIYDGYDETALILEELCGILNTEIKVVQTSTSAVYLILTMDESNSGSLFHIVWTNTDRAMINLNTASKVNCGFNNTELITPEHVKEFHSPNYPEDYRNGLNCQWIFKSNTGNHLNLHFYDLQIEDTNNCYSDSLSLYTSDTLGQWKPIKESFCTLESITDYTNISTYLKVTFKTDTTVTKKGFRAIVSCACGGLVTGPAGKIEPVWNNFHFQGSLYYETYNNYTRCDWTIKVRPGRVISLQFEHFNITYENNKCITSVILHNGDSINAPLLASGKYCGNSHENKTDIVTSSNALFVSYVTVPTYYIKLYMFQNFRIRYEEKSVECGFTATLDIDHPWEIIKTPNYPSVPAPYSECVWVITGLPGEILRVDFLDRFDLDNVNDCATEVVELRDGSSELAPLLSRLCGEKPGTVKSRSNVLFIKYTTLLAEPRNGFKANISIDVCGGTIISNAGEILSPGYPHLIPLPYNKVCEWRIIGSPRTTLLLKPQYIDLPLSEARCGTYVKVQEHISVNNTKVNLKEWCSDSVPTDTSLIETSTNAVIIQFYMSQLEKGTKLSEHRGFRFTFNSSNIICGGHITTSEGFLTTPGYPLETSIKYCRWVITVPNKNRRVRIEILDVDITKQRIFIFNDVKTFSLIKRIPDKDIDLTSLTFESTTYKLVLNLWLHPFIAQHRFKARFSSEDPIFCGGELSGLSGELISPQLQRSYTCEWHYNNEALIIHDSFKYNTIFITVSANSSVVGTMCSFFSPILNIKSTVNNKGLIFSRNICGNTNVSYRVPSYVVNLIAIKDSSSSFYFHLDWKSQPCGGTLHAGQNPVNVLSVPNLYNDTLDCAWIVVVPVNNRVQLKIEGSFKLNCDDEFVKISQGFTVNSPYIGDYCKTKAQDDPILTNFEYLYIEYHSNVKNNTDIKLYVKTINVQCGGTFLTDQNEFQSPNFPNPYLPNQECTWELLADLGYRITLTFIQRFVIEDRVNCTKDVVIIYDWKGDEYIEIARLCGRNLPHLYNSTYNRMKVVLRTDAETNLDGFKAKWAPTCGGNFIASEKEQFLYSPHFPGYYPPDMNCSYEISAPGKKVLVKFLEFDLEGSYPDCKNDNLTITSQSYVSYFYKVYCGKELPSTLSFDKILLEFKTDGYSQRRGFKISFKIYSCGGKINTNTKISSNDFENYHEDMNCTWTIVAPSNKVVILKFLHIDIEETNICGNDYISAFDGQIIDPNKRLALICGYVNSTITLRSNENTMLLQFVSNANYQLTGFKAIVTFSYSESVGCGGAIEMRIDSSQMLNSPLINGSSVYENYFDCLWTITAPIDTHIKIEFTSFHIAPCQDVNQTALGFNKCDCDFVQVIDGINPNSLIIGKYCGHTLPPQLKSSGHMMSVRFLTDGAIASAGFAAKLNIEQTECGQTKYTISREVQYLKSPNYDLGSIPRGIHCSYELDNSKNKFSDVHLTVKVDLQSPTTENDGSSICSKDKLFISSIHNKINTTIQKDYVLYLERNAFFSRSMFYELSFPKQIELCGHKDIVDLYFYGNVYLNIITSPESNSNHYKGFQVEMVNVGYCSRNYTEPHGRIEILSGMEDSAQNCYTLITAPENYTISLYFMIIFPDYSQENSYLDIYDGNNSSATKLVRLNTEYLDNYPVFSTGRYILLHNHRIVDKDRPYGGLAYDLNYVTTAKGKGCGGKIVNEIGRVTSPLYPSIYRQKSACEWELETPFGTQLLLRFSAFDMGKYCEQNYVQLIDRKGSIQRTFCSETPADFTSNDNYVKIVYVTSLNNGGMGWIADFVGIQRNN